MKAVYGPSNPNEISDGVQRFGSVISLKPEMEQRYRELHANVWGSVTARLKDCNIRNYSIYLMEIERKKYLFSYFEYTGSDLDVDMQAMADDPETLRWWQETDPCQTKLPNRASGESWAGMERVFFMA
jgi:L-rhamnose mutarotase